MPRTEIVQFGAEVSSSGYEWGRAALWNIEEKPTHVGIFLAERGRGRGERKRYEPLQNKEYSGLFREFAKVSLTKEGMQTFANQYGLLGCGPLIRLDSGQVRQGETFGLWEEEIA